MTNGNQNKYCIKCGIILRDEHGNKQYCDDCWSVHEREYFERYNKEYYRENRDRWAQYYNQRKKAGSLRRLGTTPFYHKARRRDDGSLDIEKEIQDVRYEKKRVLNNPPSFQQYDDFDDAVVDEYDESAPMVEWEMNDRGDWVIADKDCIKPKRTRSEIYDGWDYVDNE